MGLFGFLGPKKAVTYKLTDRQGKAKYIGTTNYPSRREEQHRASGKKFSRLVVTSRPVSRRTADRYESRNLSSYRRATGSRPTYNKTNNGKFNRW
jgi:predicted GIY-YIG superfamily endonuclease